MRAMIIALIVIAAVAVLLIMVVAGASGIYLPKKYHEAWNPGYFKQFNDVRLQVVAHGLLAANSHNMQAWKVVPDESDKDTFWLYINTDRLTQQVDPYSRQLTISQGTFLQYAAIASQKLGYKADIVLFPQGEFAEKDNIDSIKSKPVAKVTLRQAASSTGPLYDMMFLPDTVRVAYQPDKLPSALANEISPGGIRVVAFQNENDLENLKEIAWQAANIEAGVERIGKETQDLFRPNEYEKNKYGYGFSLEGQGFTGANIAIVEALLTLFPSMNNQKSSTDSFLSGTRTALDNTPAFIMIISADNSRTTQVRTGMLYSSIQLSCQSQGFYLQPMSQALEEYPEMTAVYDKIHAEYAGPGETIQMLARAGKPVRDVERSMRMSVNDLVSK